MRPTVRPLNSELARPNEAVRVLKKELFSTKPEINPTELVKVLERPFV